MLVKLDTDVAGRTYFFPIQEILGWLDHPPLLPPSLAEAALRLLKIRVPEELVASDDLLDAACVTHMQIASPGGVVAVHRPSCFAPPDNIGGPATEQRLPEYPEYPARVDGVLRDCCSLPAATGKRRGSDERSAAEALLTLKMGKQTSE